LTLANIFTKSAALEEVNKATLGITHAYDDSPETIGLGNFPAAIRYPKSGDFEHSRGLGRHNIHHFVVEVHIERGRPGGLAECEKRARVFIEKYQNLYAGNLSISGTCDVSGFDKPSWEYGYLEWGDEKTIGVRFYMWAKEMLDSITVNL
jgi:hypothetical protein